MADAMGYYKSFSTKSEAEGSEAKIMGWLKVEHLHRIAEVLGCGVEEVDYRHRWYDLDDPADRATALSQDEFTMNLHRGELLLESYGTRKKVAPSTSQRK